MMGPLMENPSEAGCAGTKARPGIPPAGDGAREGVIDAMYIRAAPVAAVDL